MTYTGPSAAEVRAHLVAGTGVTYDSASGVISIGQDVSTSSDVQFNQVTLTGSLRGPSTMYIDPAAYDSISGKVVILGDLQVDGTQTIVNSTTVTINDKNIILADSASDSSEANGAGITVNGANATITYSASEDEWQFNKKIQAPNLEVSDTIVVENITATTISGEYTGFDSDFAQKTTNDLTEGSTNLYYTKERVDSDAGARLSRATTDSLGEGSTNLYYTDERVEALVDSAYVQSRQRTNITVENATLFDSLNSGQFLRSDIQDSAYGYITFAGKTRFDGQIGGSNKERGVYIGRSPGDDPQIQLQGNGDVNPHIDFANGQEDFDMRIILTGDDALNVTGGSLYNEGNRVLTTADEGSGNGLDADTLDGQEGSYYLDYNNFTNKPVTVDSLGVQSIVITQVDSAYVQSRQDYAYSSLTGVPTNVSQFTNDANYLDSITVQGVIDATYIQANQITYDLLDSAEVIAIVDSAYVQARQDYAYSSLTGAPTNVSQFTNDANYLDSNTAKVLIDSAYIGTVYDQSLNTTDDVTFNTVTADDFIGDLNGAVRFIGRADVDMSKGQVVYVTGVQGNMSTIDLARANNSSTMPAMGFVSADVSASNNVEVVTFGNLQHLDVADFGETGITFGPNDIVYVSASEAGHVTNVKPSGESNLIQNIGRIQRHTPTSNMAIKVGGAGRTNATPNLDADQFFLGNDSNYSVATDFATAIADVVDSSFVKARVTTDQDLRTTDSVTFSGLTVSGDFVVTGQTTQVNTISYTVNDPLIHLADSNELSDVVDIGFIGHYYGDGQRRHTGVFRDASNEEYYIFNNMVDSSFDSSLPPNVIDRNSTDFELSTLNVKRIRGIYDGFDSDFSSKSTDDLTEGSNLYYTEGRFDTRFAAKSTSDLSEGLNLYYTTARHDSDTLAQVNAAYVQARQITYSNVSEFTNDANYLDSNTVQGVIDTTYIQSIQTTYNTSDFTDSAFVTGLPVSTFTNDVKYLDSNTVQDVIDASYIENLRPAETIFTIVNNGASAYTFSGDGFSSSRDNPTLYLTRGKTYKFSVSASGHPFEIRVSSGGSAYSTGVTNNGAQTGDIIFTPDMNAPTSLVYQCTVHSGMLGNIVIIDDTSWLDSSEIINLATSLIDSDYVQARTVAGTDSAATIALIQATVDSAYVAAREANSGSGGAGTDSATVISLIQVTADSAYIQARQLNEVAAELTQSTTNFVATASQTSFTGLDIDSDKFQVYLNGLLLPRADYTHNSTRVDLVVAADSGDVLEVLKFTGNDTGATAIQQRHYIYTATSGQTVFTGADDNGATLSYTQNRINVYLNGLLLLDSADYTQNSAGTTVTFTSGVTAGHIVDIQTLTGNTGTFSPLVQTLYEFTADSGQTVFTGADNNAATLDFSNDKVTVYLNGILLSGTDYTLSSGNTVTLDVGADSGNLLTVAKLSGNNIGLDSGEVKDLIDSAYIQARQSSVGSGGIDSAATQAMIDSNFLAVNSHFIPSLDSTFDLGHSTKKWKDLYLSGNTIYMSGHNIHKQGNAFRFVDSNGSLVNLIASNIFDSAQVLAITAQDALDSAIVAAIVDSAYIQLRDRFQDSAGIQAVINEAYLSTIIDSAYVNARTTGGGGGSGAIDSALTTQLVDSAYIKFRVDYDANEELQFGKDQYVKGTVTGSTSGTLIYSDFNPGQADGLFTSSYNYANGGVDIDQWVWGYYWVNSSLGYAQIATKVDNGNGTYTYTTSPALSWSAGWTNYVVLADRVGGEDTPLKIRYNDTSDVVEFNAKKQIRIYHSDESDRPLWINASYLDLNGSPVYFSNRFDSNSLFPSATDYPGMIATFDSNVTNGPGAAYISLEGAWSKISGTGIDSAEAKKVTLEVIDSDHFIPGKGERNWNITSASPPEISTGDLWLDRDDYILYRLTASSNWTSSMPAHSFAAYPGLTSTDWANSGGGTNGSFSIDQSNTPPGPNGTFASTFTMGTSPYNSGGQYTFSNPVNLGYFHIGNLASGWIHRVDYVDGSYAQTNTGPTGQPSSITWYNYDNTSMGTTRSYVSGTTFLYHPNGVLATSFVIGRSNYGTRSYQAWIFFSGSNYWNRVGEIYDSSDIKALIDSDFINSKVSAGTDSATVLALIDSDYIAARSGAATPIGQTHYHFTADSGQTVFSGADDDSATLAYNANGIMVFLNGILLIDSVDYTATDGSTITLLDSAALSDVISVVKMNGTASGATGLDSGSITALVDSAYIQLRDRFQDSAGVIQLVDSSLVQLKAIGLNYNVLSNTPTALDSADVTNLIDAGFTARAGNANEIMIVDSTGNDIESTSILSLDTTNNYIGINQSSPQVTLHMTGEGAQTSQIRMEQYNSSADAPDVRTRRYRGTIASPSAIQSGDYLYRSNHEFWNGSALIVGGQFAFDNTNNANRTQFTVAVTTDGTSVEASTNDDVQFKIDGNDNGAITFNDAYKFPTSDGSASQVLQTDGNGNLSFVSVSGIGGGLDSADVTNLIDSAYVEARQSKVFNRVFVSGQDEFNADSTRDQIIFEAGLGITLTTDPNTDTLTIAGHAEVDSAFITNIIDSAYIQARQTAGGGGSGTVDSAQTISLIEATVDSDYIGTKVDFTRGEFVNEKSQYTATAAQTVFSHSSIDPTHLDVYLNGVLQVVNDDYTATSSGVTFTSGVDSGYSVTIVEKRGRVLTQRGLVESKYYFTTPTPITSITGADDNGNTLDYSDGFLDVYLNGMLLKDSDDYSTNAGTTVTLVSATDSNDLVTLINRKGVVVTPNVKNYEFTATAGQTTFSGADINGNTLAYVPGAAQVFLNGILLRNVDYTGITGTSIVLADSASLNDELVVSAFSNPGQNMDLYKFTADSGQTIFSGNDLTGASLAYQPGNIQVFMNGLLLNDSDDYTASNGMSVVLTSGADLSDEIKIASFVSNADVIRTNAWSAPTGTPVTASAGDKLFIDTSSAKTVTLPSSASMGDEIRIIDVTGNASTNNITVSRNGHKIQGAASDLTINVDRAGIGLVYYNSAQGWVLIEN
ncbi:hypothetical protein OAA57_00005 [bacterium]|nr:hypothetical protein [bacterium]